MWRKFSGPFWPHNSIMVSVWLSEGIFSRIKNNNATRISHSGIKSGSVMRPILASKESRIVKTVSFGPSRSQMSSIKGSAIQRSAQPGVRSAAGASLDHFGSRTPLRELWQSTPTDTAPCRKSSMRRFGGDCKETPMGSGFNKTSHRWQQATSSSGRTYYFAYIVCNTFLVSLSESFVCQRTSQWSAELSTLTYCKWKIISRIDGTVPSCIISYFITFAIRVRHEVGYPKYASVLNSPPEKFASPSRLWFRGSESSVSYACYNEFLQFLKHRN